MKAIKKKRLRQKRRHARLRRKVVGTEERPRLFVKKSLAHTYAQVIDDINGKTIAAANTHMAGTRAELSGTANLAAAKVIGKEIAERVLALGVNCVCFDRGGCKYHGRVKALADAAREAGLKF